jgi:hypothetical protein
MRRIAAFLAVSVTLWALEGSVTERDERLRDGTILTRCTTFCHANQCAILNFRRKSAGLSALQGV